MRQIVWYILDNTNNSVTNGGLVKLLTLILTLMLMPAAFAAKSGKVQEIVLTDENTISLRTAFTDDSVGRLIAEADKLNSRLPSGQPIYLFLRTPGGSIQAGLELFEYLKGLNRPVHTITLFAASMGFQTVQQLGNRYILKYGILMSHRASGGFQGEFGGEASQMDSRYGLWLRRIQLLDKETVARTRGKQTLKSYQAAYANELWLNGEEAVQQGYADAVVTVKCHASLENKTEDYDIRDFFASATVTVSRCPMKTGILDVKANVVTNKGPMALNQFLAVNPEFKSCQQVSEEQQMRGLPVDPTCVISPTVNMLSITQRMKEAADMLGGDLTKKVIRN